MTSALELAKMGHSVILLEAGGKDRAGKSQDLYRGEVVDPERHLSLESDRYRQLGGTTGVWGGRCIPFDPVDFEKRDFVPHSGWPITRTDLDPYFVKANKYCQCGRSDFDSTTSLPDSSKDMIPGFKDGDVETHSIERWSPPTNFGKEYREDLKKSDNIRVLMYAVCVGLDMNEDGTSVAALDVATPSGSSKRFRIEAGRVILSGGGLETTRLLLASDKRNAGGIGNHSDWLGRGYQCHISGIIAKVRFQDDANIVYGYEVDPDGVYCRRRLTISDEAQKRDGLLNIHILLDRPLVGDPEHGNAILSMTFLAKALAQKARTRSSGGGKYSLYWRHALNVLSGAPEVLSFLPQWCRKRFVHGRRVPSLLLRSPNNTYHLYYHTEQIPNRDSRVSLSDEKDVLGMRMLKVDYRIADADVESILKTHELIKREFSSQGCGELSFLEDNPREEIRNHCAVLGHHIGTTRMSEDPSEGVVDPDCKVHGISNLYIASSSVFPTSSQANPTLTIVAMALRLTEHIGHPLAESTSL